MLLVFYLVLLQGLLSNLDLKGLLSNTTRGQRREPSNLVVLKQPNTRLRPDQIDALVAEYVAGTELKQIATKFSVHESTVKAHVRRSGVPLRPRRALTDRQVQKATRLYVEEGWSILKISKHLHCAEATVRSELERAGVELRGRGRPKSGS